MQAWSNRLLALISDVSIVFCRATFNTLPFGKKSGTLVLNTINKNIGESLQNRNLDFNMPWDKLKFNCKITINKMPCLKDSLWSVDRIGMMIKLWLTSPNQDESGLSLPKARGLMINLVTSNLSLSHGIWKSRLWFCRLSPKFLSF